MILYGYLFCKQIFYFCNKRWKLQAISRCDYKDLAVLSVLIVIIQIAFYKAIFQNKVQWFRNELVWFLMHEVLSKKA